MKMIGGGRRFPTRLRQFTCREPIWKRRLPKAATFDKAATCEAAAEISRLKKKVSAKEEELRCVKSSFQREVDAHVRLGVRKARLADDDASYQSQAAQLRAELLSARQQIYDARDLCKRNDEVTSLRRKLADWDLSIADLNAKLLAAPKAASVQHRHLANATNKMNQRAGELKAMASEAKKLRTEASEARVRAQGEKLRAEELEKDSVEKLETMAAIESNAKEALHEMEAEHDRATARANAKIQQLMSELAAVKAKSRKVEGPAGHSAEQFTALSEGAHRVARSRGVAFALSFLEQREWQAEDWIAVLKNKELVEDICISKEVWSLRMEWARTLFGECMSTHWGTSRLGCYLALTEHMPSRQIRRIKQAASNDYSSETDKYSKRVLLRNPYCAADVLHVPNILPPLYKFMPDIKALTEEHGLSMTADGRAGLPSKP